MNALIGYTGFVGSNLARQHRFDAKYNSRNIDEIAHREFDTIVCAGIPGTKWIANKFPDRDWNTIAKLLRNLKTVRCGKFIHISTVDVYADPRGVDENTQIRLQGLHPYGRHRARAEEFVRSTFSDYHIIRLPAIYGHGIKKNFVFDLLNNHCLHWTHKDSIFQFYYLEHLWQDIQLAVAHNIRVINFNAEPISAGELAQECFAIEFSNITERPPLRYDVRSLYSSLYNQHSDYMYSREEVLRDMRHFIAEYRRQSQMGR